MSAVTASILVGTRNRVDLGIQPRWLILLHEANGYAWHLIRLQLTTADVVHAAKPPPAGKAPKAAPGTVPGLDTPPGILWRAAPGGDLIGELALLLHLHVCRTPEVLAAAKRIEPLAKRRVDLAYLDGAQRGDLGNAIRIARQQGGGFFLAATVLPGSRLDAEGLLDLPNWEISIAETILSRDWVRLDGGHLQLTDHRLPPEPVVPEEGSDWYEEPGLPSVSAPAGPATDQVPDTSTPGVSTPGQAAPGPTASAAESGAAPNEGAAPAEVAGAPTPPAAATPRSRLSIPARLRRRKDDALAPTEPPAGPAGQGSATVAGTVAGATVAGVTGAGAAAAGVAAAGQPKDRDMSAQPEIIPEDDLDTADDGSGTWLDDFLRD